MSPVKRFLPRLADRFPRVSGDEPREGTGEDYGTRFSPRERG